MYDWKESYQSAAAMAQDLRMKPMTHCGWVIEDTEFMLVAICRADGTMVYTGPIDLKKDDVIVVYVFSGHISESPFGQTIPTVRDNRTT